MATLYLHRLSPSDLLWIAMIVATDPILQVLTRRTILASEDFSNGGGGFTDEELLAFIYLTTGLTPHEPHYFNSWLSFLCRLRISPTNVPLGWFAELSTDRQLNPDDWVAQARALLDVQL